MAGQPTSTSAVQSNNQPVEWSIDPAHSQIQFTVRHMMISNVRGRFESFSGKVDFDEANPERTKVDIEIDAAGIYIPRSLSGTGI